MLIREYTPADLDALRRMHASQGFDYAFPDLSDPIFISKLVLEDDSGHPVMAALARLTCEMYLLVDRTDSSCSAGILPANFPRPQENQNRQPEAGDTKSSHVAQVFRPEAFAAPSERETSPLKRRATCEGEYRGAQSPPSRALPARQRYEWLLALHRAGELDLLARGLDDAHAWLPPPIAKRFGRRLESLGWLRDDTWTPYCKRLKSGG